MEGGQGVAFAELEDYIEARFDPTIRTQIIHGIVGFGLRWKAICMKSTEDRRVSTHSLASYFVVGLTSPLRM
jgi:hypothetical protein